MTPKQEANQYSAKSEVPEICAKSHNQDTEVRSGLVRPGHLV